MRIKNPDSLCHLCVHLEVLNGEDGCRFVCFKEPLKRAFGEYGRNVAKGYPKVKRCASAKIGTIHWSHLNLIKDGVC